MLWKSYTPTNTTHPVSPSFYTNSSNYMIARTHAHTQAPWFAHLRIGNKAWQSGARTPACTHKRIDAPIPCTQTFPLHARNAPHNSHTSIGLIIPTLPSIDSSSYFWFSLFPVFINSHRARLSSLGGSISLVGVHFAPRQARFVYLLIMHLRSNIWRNSLFSPRHFLLRVLI